MIRLASYRATGYILLKSDLNNQVGSRPTFFMAGALVAEGTDKYSALMVDAAAEPLAPVVVPVIETLGFELVRLSLAGGNLQIMAERPDGTNVGIDDCGVISRAVSAALDEADPIAEPYTLEVGSPGIDRLLTRPKDFARWAGFEVKMETTAPVDGQSKFKGRITACEGDTVTLRDEAGKDHALALSALKRARLILNDELLAANKRAA